jgi:thymidine phosphorylase
VPSIGLIAASIVSKKIAGGAQAIVFDVKVGGGAFVRTREEAVALATTMVRLAEHSGRRSSAIVTDMDEPLAACVGTGLEAIEARDFLRAGWAGDSRFARLAVIIAGEMLRVGGVREAEIEPRIERALRGGAAYERFVALIEAQGGARGTLEALAPASPDTPVPAPAGGCVQAIEAVAIGEAARDLVERGGPFAGIRIVAPVGTRIARGDPLASIAGPAADVARVRGAFTLGSGAPAPRPLVSAVVRDASLAPSSNLGLQ